MLERYKLIFAYDGTNYFGSQRQANAPTVQRALEKALTTIGWEGNSVLLSGRTDTGVHASGQVAAFDMRWEHGPGDMVKAINANLPDDMVASSVERAAPDFHPRFDALSRTYRYELYFEPFRDPFKDRFATRIYPPLEWDGMNDRAGQVLGVHDFAAFGTPPRAEQSTIRRMITSAWSKENSGWTYTVQASGFLYHMVRRLVYLQIVIAQGKLPDDTLENLLLAPAKKVLPGLAPARGLKLVNVEYPEGSGIINIRE